MTVGIVHSEESITYLAGDPDAPDRGFAGASGLTFSGRVETSAETCIRCAAVTHSPPENLVETITFQTTRTFPTRQQAEAYAKTWSPPPPGCLVIQAPDGESGLLMPGAVVHAPDMTIRGCTLALRHHITGPPPRIASGSLPTPPPLTYRVVEDTGENGLEKWWEVGFVWPRPLTGSAMTGWQDTTAGLSLRMMWSEDLAAWSPGLYTDAPGSPFPDGGGYQYWCRSTMPVDSEWKQAIITAESTVHRGDPRNNPFTALTIANAPQLLPNFPYEMPGDAPLMQADLRAAGWIGATVTAASDVVWKIVIPGVDHSSYNSYSFVEWPMYLVPHIYVDLVNTVSNRGFSGAFINLAGTRTAVAKQFARLGLSSL
jgi:hypothetical protein